MLYWFETRNRSSETIQLKWKPHDASNKKAQFPAKTHQQIKADLFLGSGGISHAFCHPRDSL